MGRLTPGHDNVTPPVPRHGKEKRELESRSLTTLIAPEVEAEALLRSTLDALSAHIAVLDETGTIIAVNQAWRSFAHTARYPGSNHGVGTNYLAVCERCAPLSEDAAKTAAALRDIIAGRHSDFRMEYPCATPEGQRWFQMRITRPSQASTRRIVIAHEDISEVKRAQDELARLSARLIGLQDEERRAIARELHDTTAQNLLAITLNASRLQEPRAATNGILTEILDLAEQSLQEVRTLSYLLHPPLLDDIGLASALSWLVRGFSERSGIEVEANIEDDGESLTREIATTLFRIAQEALTNVQRHSGSSWARLTLRRTGKAVALEVVDRGRGFETVGDQGAHPIGVGISGMRVRLEQLGGSLAIRSSLSGTRVTAILPIGPQRSV